MTRGKSNSVRWTAPQVDMIELALLVPWIKPGIAAVALGVHRATIHNCMKDGRLTWAYRGGSKLRSVYSPDVLRLVLVDIERDEHLHCDMGHCSDAFVERIRTAVDEHDLHTANANKRTDERTASPETRNAVQKSSTS